MLELGEEQGNAGLSGCVPVPMPGRAGTSLSHGALGPAELPKSLGVGESSGLMGIRRSSRVWCTKMLKEREGISVGGWHPDVLGGFSWS